MIDSIIIWIMQRNLYITVVTKLSKEVVIKKKSLLKKIVHST